MPGWIDFNRHEVRDDEMKYSSIVFPLMLSTSAAYSACPAAYALVHAYGISSSGFDKPLPKSEPQDRNGIPDSNVVMLPLWRDQPVVHDGFQHSAWINRKTKQAWIVRTGGFAGVREWYGPVVVENLDFSGCEIGPAPIPKETSAR
jgi:hypothetical protein